MHRQITAKTLLMKRTSTFCILSSSSEKLVKIFWQKILRKNILQFNDLCKAVKMDRKKHSALDKTILAETEPEEKSQRPKKPRKQLPPLAKAFADSDDDDESDAVGSEDDQNESSGEEDDS